MSEEQLKRNLAAIEEAEKARDPFAKVRDGNARALVSRLRLYANSDGGPYPHMDAESAADTIERLQAEVERMRKQS